MTLECFNQRPLTVVDACRDYLVRRGVLERLRQRQCVSEERLRRELEELDDSLQRAMATFGAPSLAAELGDELGAVRQMECA